jgi:hypothetical protein
MARKQTKALEEQGYSKLDAYCIGLHEYYKSLRKAGFPEGVVLFMITDTQSYPHWILPDPIAPEKLGDYEDDEDDY